MVTPPHVHGWSYFFSSKEPYTFIYTEVSRYSLLLWQVESWKTQYKELKTEGSEFIEPEVVLGVSWPCCRDCRNADRPPKKLQCGTIT